MTVLTQRYNSFHVQYIPRGITPSLSHIRQVFDNCYAPTHLSAWLGLLDSASSDSIIRRRPVERGRVRMRRKRAQPQQGISETTHSSQLDTAREPSINSNHIAHRSAVIIATLVGGSYALMCTQFYA